jgi:hypothetical protein
LLLVANNQGTRRGLPRERKLRGRTIDRWQAESTSGKTQNQELVKFGRGFFEAAACNHNLCFQLLSLYLSDLSDERRKYETLHGRCSIRGCFARRLACARAGETKQDKIERALSAAPPAVAKDAKVVDLDEQGKMTVLREGTNGFTCFPGHPGVVDEALALRSQVERSADDP